MIASFVGKILMLRVSTTKTMKILLPKNALLYGIYILQTNQGERLTFGDKRFSVRPNKEYTSNP